MSGAVCRPAATSIAVLTALEPLPQEEDRVVIIRFGHDYDETCMQMDEVRSCCSGRRQRRRGSGRLGEMPPTCCLQKRLLTPTPPLGSC